MAEPPATVPPSGPPGKPEPPRDGEEEEIEASRAPLLDHLNELRMRLIVSVIAIAIGFVITLIFAEPLYKFLVEPFGRAMVRVRGEFSTDIKLIFTEPLEQFFVYLKLSLFGGIVLAFPVVAYQAYAFIAPGLYKRERATVLPYLIASPVLFALGAALVYSFVLPFVMRFALRSEVGAEPFDMAAIEGVAQFCPQLAALSAEQARAVVGLLGATCPGLSAEDLTTLTANVSAALAEYGRQPRTELLPKVSAYLSLVTTLILAFGFSFQMPIVLSFAGRAGLVTASMLRKGRKYAIVAIFAFAAFITPPDPLSQIILGLAIMALYEVSVLSVRMVERRREAEEAAEAAAQT